MAAAIAQLFIDQDLAETQQGGDYLADAADGLGHRNDTCSPIGERSNIATLLNDR